MKQNPANIEKFQKAQRIIPKGSSKIKPQKRQSGTGVAAAGTLKTGDAIKKARDANAYLRQQPKKNNSDSGNRCANQKLA